MRLSGLTCFLLLFSFSLFAQPADYELIRRDLEKVDSLIFTGNAVEAESLLNMIAVEQLTRESQLLIQVFKMTTAILRREYGKVKEGFAEVEEEVSRSGDLFLKGHLSLSKGIYFFRISEKDSSEFHLDMAYKYFEGGGNGHGMFLASYHQMYNYYWKMGDTDKGISSALVSLNLLKERRVETVFHADVYYTLGSMYHAQADVARAKVFILKSIVLATRVAWDRLANNGYVVLGNIHYTSGEYKEAIPFYLKAIDNIKKAEGPKSYSLINYYSNCGYMYSLLGDYSRSAEMLHRAKSIAKLLQGESSEEYSMILYNLADLALKKGLIDSAKYYYNENIRIKYAVYGDKHEELGWAYNGLATMFNELQLYDSALFFIQKAIVANHEGFDNQDLNANPDVAGLKVSTALFHLLYRKERYLIEKWKRNNRGITEKPVIELYQKLDSILFASRSGLSNDISKLYLFDDMKGVFELGLEIYEKLLQNQPSNQDYLEAFYSILQKSKSILLLEDLSKSEKARENVIPIEFRDEEQRIKATLAKIEKQATANFLSDSVVDVRFTLNNRLDSLYKEIAQRFPAYYAFRISENLNSLDELRTNLEDHNSLFAEFYWGKENVYALYFDGENFRVKRMAGKQRIQSSLSEVMSILASGANEPQKYSEQAYALTQELLGDNFLKGAHHANTLQIVPDGALTSLPFDALLVSPANADENFSNFDYLLKTIAVVYSYNSSFLLNAPDFSSSEVLALGAYDADYSHSFSLPGSKRELDAIRKIKRGKFIYRAQKEDLLKSLGDNRIIHLAVHGETDTASFFGSFLQFLSSDSLNSKLFPYELYDKNIDSDLVVLTACESGLGKIMGGEGVFNMGRAFKYAGARAIIQSVWKTDDAATADLISDFYQYIQDGEGYAEALHMTKQNILISGDDRTAHPHRWAALAYYGIPHKKGEPNMILITLIGICLGSIGVYYIKSKLK